MVHELTTGKSVCILGTVIACFAVLWPNIFYPMLRGSISNSHVDRCCDVLLDKDVNGVKLMNELCGTVLKLSDKYKNNFTLPSVRLNKDALKYCRDVVFETCDIDINALLKDTIKLDPSYKNVLNNIRTVNHSLCLKYHFDVTLDLLGTPHRVKKFNITVSKYQRQERPPHKPEEVHSTFPQMHSPVSKLDDISPQPFPISQPDTSSEPISSINHLDPMSHPNIYPPSRLQAHSSERILPNKPPLPGMRPPMGGGYVAQQKGSGTMGILMPMYTIAIVAFFTYSILRLLSKKNETASNFQRDPDFCRTVFDNNEEEETRQPVHTVPDTSKLGWHEKDIRDIEIDHLRRRLAETEATMDRIVKQMNLVSMTLTKPLIENMIPQEIPKVIRKEEALDKTVNGVIEVVEMQLNESCENGQLWKQPLPAPTKNESILPIIPQEIILTGNVPVNSEILVSDAHTENVSTESSVILESKVTLNVISPELKNEQNPEKVEEIKNVNGNQNELDNNEDMCRKMKVNGKDSSNADEEEEKEKEEKFGEEEEEDEEEEEKEEEEEECDEIVNETNETKNRDNDIGEIKESEEEIEHTEL